MLDQNLQEIKYYHDWQPPKYQAAPVPPRAPFVSRYKAAPARAPFVSRFAKK